MEYRKTNRWILEILLVGLISYMLATRQERHYAPKPRAYFRIEFPKKDYQLYHTKCPFTFQYPKYAYIRPYYRQKDAIPCWLNIQFPQFKGTLHITYQSVTSGKMLYSLVEDAHTFAFKHTVKATAIDEGIITYPNKGVYGLFYQIGGNTASSVQFYLTDSIQNYIRGSLYFSEAPRMDSIQPVLDFLKKDVDILIKSFRWRK